MDKTKLHELLNLGYTHKQIANELGCTRAAVSYAAKKCGLKPNHSRIKIDVDKLHQEVESGMSFSDFARKYGHTIQSISKIAKKHGIESKANNVTRDLPDSKIYDEYMAGDSLYVLMNRYNVPVPSIKKRLRKIDPAVVIRSMDDAKRPHILNCRQLLADLSNTKSYGQIAREFGVKLSTVTNAAKKFGLPFIFRKLWSFIDYDILFDRYLLKKQQPSQIASELSYPYGVILRQLRRAGFPIKRPGGEEHLSKYLELNDPVWLTDNYKDRSANSIANQINAPVGMVLYHLRKHNITIRSKDEYLQLLMETVHGIKSEFDGIKCHSQLEHSFLKQVDKTSIVERDIKIEYGGSYCFVDFKVDGELVEVKPKEVLKQSGPDRKRLVKQFKICEKAGMNLKVWTKSGFWDGIITEDDKFHAANWKLFFDTPKACFEWLLARGFEAPRYGLLELADSASKMTVCNGRYLEAGYGNKHPARLTTHFFPHFWQSTHKEYQPITAAWELGNTKVLQKAVEQLWLQKLEVNIYGLLKCIQRSFKDFSVVSIFKPWIAAYLYDRYLPNGGVVIDPCCGWGGRFMASAGRDIKYIGYDLNSNGIKSHSALADFLGSRVKHQPEFHQADSSVVKFQDGDLLFTSPPYDDTELYSGIDSYKTMTKPIVENVFDQFKGIIVLNVPKRQETMVLDVARFHGRNMVDRLEMKTGSFMGRTVTYEPILVFGRVC